MGTCNRWKVVLKLLMLVLLCCLMSGGNVLAQGQFFIAPHVETGWQRDTNFNKSETNTKTVDTYTVSPGFDLGYTTEKSTIELQYALNAVYYDDQDTVLAGEKPADDYDYTGHAMNFSASTKPTDRLQLGLNFPFMRSRDPANSDDASNAIDRYKFNISQVNPWLDYAFGEKFGFRVDYTYQNTDYSDDGPGEGEDSEQNKAGLKLYYMFNTNTSVDLNYQYWTRDYAKTTPNYDSHQVMMNLNHQLNRLRMSVGGGYQTRIIDSSTANDFDGFVMSASLTGEFPNTNIKLDVTHNYNDYGVDNEYYAATKVSLSVTHIFFETLQPTLEVGYQNSDYEISNRDDDRWYASGNVDYLIGRFFSVGIGGGYEKRDSNQTGNDYDNKYVMVTAKFMYDTRSE